MDDLPVVEELASLRALTERLRVENARLLRLLELTPKQAAPPSPGEHPRRQVGLVAGCAWWVA